MYPEANLQRQSPFAAMMHARQLEMGTIRQVENSPQSDKHKSEAKDLRLASMLCMYAHKQLTQARSGHILLCFGIRTAQCSCISRSSQCQPLWRAFTHRSACRFHCNMRPKVEARNVAEKHKRSPYDSPFPTIFGSNSQCAPQPCC